MIPTSSLDVQVVLNLVRLPLWLREYWSTSKKIKFYRECKILVHFNLCRKGTLPIRYAVSSVPNAIYLNWIWSGNFLVVLIFSTVVNCLVILGFFLSYLFFFGPVGCDLRLFNVSNGKHFKAGRKQQTVQYN